MKTNLIISMTFLLAVLLISRTMTAVADRTGDDKRWEKPEEMGKTIKGENRILQYRVWDNGVTVTSMGRDGEQVNVFFFTLKLDKGVFMHYNYFRASYCDEANDFHERVADNRTFPENGGRPPPPEGSKDDKEPFEDLGFSILMKKLRESNETVRGISPYRFEDVNFTKPVVLLIKEDGTVTGLKIRTGTEDGIFGLTFYLVSTVQYGQERGISPFEVKYDISIKDYPFRAVDSFLELETIFSFPEMFLKAPGDRKFDEKPLPSDWKSPSKERTLGIDVESLSMFFSWATNVTVDGEDHNVTAEYTVSVDGESTMVEKMTFIYPQGQSILHDPKIGVSDLLEIAEDATEFIELLISWSTGLGIGVVLIAVVAVRMKPAKFDWED